ncbi:MAG: hypothetical protein JJU36_06725 [Phycisphaeraceae bacterium]|nr:hypothetical protein [Phycisphaeraceae bacterium]
MAKPATANRKSKDIIRALMDPALPDTVPWSSSDLRAILEHQLDVSLAQESDRLAESNRQSAEQMASILSRCSKSTFGSILNDAMPAEDAVELIKNYAKASLAGDGDLPRDVARVLYVMAILRGRFAGYEGVSSLDESSLDREAQRCLTFGWLPGRVSDLIRTLSMRGG